MKRNLIFTAIAAVALSSCSKDDAVGINETGKSISFGVLNNKVQSKAIETTVTNIANFKVYAYNYADAGTVDYTTNAPYYDGVTINVDNVGSCTYADAAKQKMWPAGKLDFLAYSPATYGTYSKGIVSVDMSAKLTAANQVDLVAAKKLAQTRLGQAEGYKVPMAFSHALSQIKFAAKSKYATVNFKIKSIKITGVNTQGTTDLTTWTPTTPNGNANTGNGLAWTIAGDVNNVTFGAKTNEVINTTVVDLTADNGALMIIPQILKGGPAIGKEAGQVTVESILADGTKSYIVIEYSATDKDTGAILVTNGRCAVPVSTELKPGLRYVYTLTLAGNGDGGATEDKLYPIDFTCTVEDWVAGPNIGIEI